MTPFVHRIYITTLVSIVVLTAIFLLYRGMPYYMTPIEERFYHPDHHWFKPSGMFGHGLGIVGTLLILIGVFGYMARKKYQWLARFGRLKYWLEFHIFLCSLGPLLILFHTAFKFGGLVSVSFWSMVAVVASGVIGRFIYIQIPRTIEGRELTLTEVQSMRGSLGSSLLSQYGIQDADLTAISRHLESTLVAQSSGVWHTLLSEITGRRKHLSQIRAVLISNHLSKPDQQRILRLARNEMVLNARIGRLLLMQRLFRYWHVAHLPFALIMLIIMVIHVAVTIAFGYRWIF